MKKASIFALWAVLILSARGWASGTQEHASSTAAPATEALPAPPAGPEIDAPATVAGPRTQTPAQPEPLPAPSGRVDASHSAPPTSAKPDPDSQRALETLLGPTAHDACAGGCQEHGCRTGCHRFWEWLTYQPLERPGLGQCCHHCTGCCVPPLYTFFPCLGGPGVQREEGHPGAGCCGNNTSANAPTSMLH